MQSSYRSPFRLLQHTAETGNEYNAGAISRARKKLVAESALLGGQIEIENKAYTRNDIQAILDSIDEKNWAKHYRIWETEHLLHFLEDASFATDNALVGGLDSWDEGEKTFLSPYFAFSFNQVMGKALRQEKFSEAIELLSYQSFINHSDSSLAFQKVRAYLDDLSYTLRNLSWEKFAADESVLHFVFSEWVMFVNALPPGFSSQIDEIIEHLIQIVLRFQKKATWHYLHVVLERLALVDTNAFNKSEIGRIDEVIYRNTKFEGSGSARGENSGKSIARYVWGVIWILLIFARALSCQHDSEFNTSNLPPLKMTMIDFATEQTRIPEFLDFLDSIGKIKASAIEPQIIKTGDQPWPLIGDDPAAAINDSFLLVNHSGSDVVLIYLKDLPGHKLSGFFPKLYSTYIRNNDSLMINILPGNGKMRFVFGSNWGKLKQPAVLQLKPSMVQTQLGVTDERSLTIDYFFQKTFRDQPFLRSPITVTAGEEQTGNDAVNVLNQRYGSSEDAQPRLEFSKRNGTITADASGRLLFGVMNNKP